MDTWKHFRLELEEDGVENERAPADEEDGGDAGEQHVGVSPALVDHRVLAWRSTNRINTEFANCNLQMCINYKGFLLMQVQVALVICGLFICEFA